MSNSASDPDLVKYCALMEDVKRRIAVIDFFVSGQGHALYLPTTVESACLQLRKVLELIAFGSLVANAEAYTAVHSKVSKAWQAADLLTELEKVNPEFYPVPIVEAASNIPGVMHELKKRDPDYLAKADFPEVYGRCGVMAHAANPYGKGIDYGYYQNTIPLWRTQIVNLLNNHQIHLVNRPALFIIHMKENRDDKVHWYKFEPVPKQLH